MPLEHLGTFEFAGYTIKPAYFLALLLMVVVIISQLARHISRSREAIVYLKSALLEIKIEEKVMFVLVIWAYLSIFWSIAPLRTFIAATLLLLMILIFVFVRRHCNEKIRHLIKSIVIYSGLILAFFSFYQLIAEHFLGVSWALLRPEYGSRVFGFARPEATFLEPLYLANFLFWPIAFAIDQKSKIKDQKFYQYWDIVILMAAFILTLSRGAYLGLALALAAVFIRYYIGKKISWPFAAKTLSSFFAAIILAGLLIFGVAGTSGLKTFAKQAVRPSDLAPTNEAERLKNREVSESYAEAALKNHKFLGIGLDAFGALPQYELLRQKGDWQTVNNQYLDIMVSLGIIGLLLWLSLIMLLVRHLIFNNKKEYHLIAIIALLVQWVTFSALNLLYIWVMLAVVWPAENKRLRNT